MIVFICFFFFFLLLCVATLLPVAYIFILGTLESRMDEMRLERLGTISAEPLLLALW